MISFHIFGMIIASWLLLKTTGNAYGVLKHSKESMLLRLLLVYWGRGVCKLKVVMFLRSKLIKEDTKIFSISIRLRRVLLLIIQKIWKHPCQAYRISHLLTLNPPYTVVPKVSLHQITLIHIKCQASVMHQI